MSKMVVFEVTSRLKNMEVKRVFIANYEASDERLFQVNLSEPEILADDMLIKVGSFTTIKRHTDSGFVAKQFHAGDQVILTAKGGWKIKHSLEGYLAVAWKRLVLYRKDVGFWIKNILKRNELGVIRREIQQNFTTLYLESR